MIHSNPQIPLALKPVWRHAFEDFLAGPNQAAVDTLKAIALGELDSWPLITGPASSGKTHLICAMTGLMDASGRRSIALSAEMLLQNEPGLLSGFSDLDCICIDDMDRLIGVAVWEHALFHLFNQIRQRQGLLVLSSSVPPAGLDVGLADLRSRLNWGLLVRLHPLSDGDKAELLHQRADAHGITLDSSVIEYLLRRLPRNLSRLLDHFEQLAERSLAAKRRLTLPFVREYVNQQGIAPNTTGDTTS